MKMLLPLIAVASFLVAGAVGELASVGSEFVFAIPFLRNNEAGTDETNFLTIINDRPHKIRYVIVHERDTHTEIIDLVDETSFKRVPIPYFDANECDGNSVALTKDVVKVHSEGERPELGQTGNISVIFEQYFADDRAKATVVQPVRTLGTKYTAPMHLADLGTATMILTAIEPELPAGTADVGTNVKIAKRGTPPGVEARQKAVTFQDLERDEALQFQLELDEYDGATVESVPTMAGGDVAAYTFAAQVADSTERVTMLMSDELLGSAYAVGPGTYLIYGIQDDVNELTRVYVDGTNIGVSLTKGQVYQLRPSTEGRIIEARSPTGVPADAHKFAVFYAAGNDWASLPSIPQFVRGRDTQFTSLRGVIGKARIIVDERLEGEMRLNGQIIPNDDYTRLSTYTYVDADNNPIRFSYVDVDLVEDLNQVTPRNANYFYTVMVFNDVASYVPLFGPDLDATFRL